MELQEKLVDAAFQGNLVLVKNLLNEISDINLCGRSWNPLHAAIENENFECVKLLIENGADIEFLNGTEQNTLNSGMSPLAHAVEISIDGSIQSNAAPGEEPTEIVNYLLSKGAKPNTAIETAISYNNQKFTYLLNKAISGS